MRYVTVLAAILTVAGCKKDQPAPEAQSAPAAAASPSTASPVAAAEQPDEKLVLDAAKLDRFIKYQQRMLEVYAQTISDLKTMDARIDAGDYGGVTGGLAAANDAVRSIERRQKAEQQARAETGLSEKDAEGIEQLVGEVVMKRQLAKTMNLDGTLQQMEQMRAGLPKEQQAGIDQSLAELKKSQDEMKNLTEERQKYGSAAVDLVLSKEADLAKNHEKLMNLWSGK